jgi:hypothetical protein
VELEASLEATFVVPKEIAASLRRPDPNYVVSIDVVSGRRSGPNNLLQCDFVQERIETLGGHVRRMHCALISEHVGSPPNSAGYRGR